MKYGLFERRWSQNLRALGLAERTVAWMVKFRALFTAVVESGITTVDAAVYGGDYNFVLAMWESSPPVTFELRHV